MIRLLFLLYFIFCISSQNSTYNASLCYPFQIQQLYFFVNQGANRVDKTFTIGNNKDPTVIYNLCQQVEIYCPYSNSVLHASMVTINQKDQVCIPYTQTSIQFIDGGVPAGNNGIYIVYTKSGNITSPTTTDNITITYACSNSGDLGCPGVDDSVLWEYFQQNQLTYFIIIQIVGVILMLLGIYIYRASIVLIGSATTFAILVLIQSLGVFVDGVPDAVISHLLTITIVCSCLVGYILGYFPKAGLFCMGLWIGFIITFILNDIALYRIATNPPNLILYILLPVLALSFGILILFIRKTFIIFSSCTHLLNAALIGSYMCLRALSLYLGAFPNEFLLAKKFHLGLEGPVPWQFSLYVIALCILTASSSAAQLWLFRRKSKKTKQTEDIEEHFNNMENTLKKERQNLIEFKNVFQDQPARKPRVLKKPMRRQTQQRPPSIHSEGTSKAEDDNNENQVSEEELPAYKDDSDQEQKSEQEQHKKNLEKKLLPVKKKY